jgi:hypothetical protein
MVDRFFEGGFEERIEGWLDRGREFVDGVAGTRPGVRRIAARRPLDAVSRRGFAAQPPANDEWPDDESFSLPRWQRADGAGARPMPRSSRRRSG